MTLPLADVINLPLIAVGGIAVALAMGAVSVPAPNYLPFFLPPPRANTEVVGKTGGGCRAEGEVEGGMAGRHPHWAPRLEFDTAGARSSPFERTA